MNECSAYVGLGVHKDTSAVAVALPGREEPVGFRVQRYRFAMLSVPRGEE